MILYHTTDPGIATSMSFSIFSMAITFPIGRGIGMAFKRRETGLKAMATMNMHLRMIWLNFHGFEVKNKEGGFTRMVDCFPDPHETRRDAARLYEA